MRKFSTTNYLIREMILIYSVYMKKQKINVQDLIKDFAFTYVDLSNIVNGIREFNSEF